MGGHRSGRHGERSRTLYVDDCAALRVWDLQREGILRAGGIFMGPMKLVGGTTAFLEVDASAIDRGWLFVDGQRIRLSTTRGVLGGLRWWMHCPKLDSRVAVLYRHPRIGRFNGREAAGLRYRSAYQDDHTVAIRQAQKALRRLAGPHYLGPVGSHVDLIPRPYRQRWDTYFSNRDRALDALARADEEFCASVGRLLGPPRQIRGLCRS